MKKPKPILYSLVVQCVRPEIGVVAEYTASSPFPHYPKGSFLELYDCEPRTWDVHDSVQRIYTGRAGQIHCLTLILADSPVVENTGYIVLKQNGEEVGPSPTRFGRIKS